jgi:hypothetical protein
VASAAPNAESASAAKAPQAAQSESAEATEDADEDRGAEFISMFRQRIIEATDRNTAWSRPA